jgi:PTH1 family peptidyl-tRNA hydrolase
LALANACNVAIKQEAKFFGGTALLQLEGQSLRLLIPSTFMNLSGKSVAAIAGFYKIPTNRILIAHDELDLSPGTARFKKGGGHGGHNGLRDTVQCLGNSKEFARLRIGIGHPGNSKQVTDYVLKKAPALEQELIDHSMDDAMRYLPLAASGQWEKAMTALHSTE